MPLVLAFAWIRDNPATATTLLLFLLGALATMVRYGLVRHREFVLFKQHMQREESEVWPKNLEAVQQLGERFAVAQREMADQVTELHAEMLRLFAKHGERLASVEAKMPNGEIREIRDMLRAMQRMERK